MSPYTYASIIISLIAVSYASPFVTPAPTPSFAAEPAFGPIATPYPVQNEPTKTLQRKNIIQDIESKITSGLGKLGSDLPSYVASGMPLSDSVMFSNLFS